jgi:hypothetical protein
MELDHVGPNQLDLSPFLSVEPSGDAQAPSRGLTRNGKSRAECRAAYSGRHPDRGCNLGHDWSAARKHRSDQTSLCRAAVTAGAVSAAGIPGPQLRRLEFQGRSCGGTATCNDMATAIARIFPQASAASFADIDKIVWVALISDVGLLLPPSNAA